MSENKESFQVIYDGTALQNHEMDVRDLAPALLAISDVLEESNKLIYGDKTRVQVNVKGTFQSGSFGFDLSVIQRGIDGFVSLFNKEEVNAATNLLAIIGLPGGGLIGFLLWLKGRKIKTISNSKSEDAHTTITLEDGDTYKTNTNVIALFSSVKVRTSIQKVITEPLSKDGIDNFSIKKGTSGFTVQKEEREYFKLSDVPDEMLRDQEREVILSVVTVSFAEGHKWKFSDGSVEFYASILDTDFIEQVQQNKDGFYKDDLFEVLLHEKQWISDSGLKSDYEIIKVLEHRSGAKQIKLPFRNDNDNK